MANSTLGFLVTVQILICDSLVIDEAHASDWFSGLLSENQSIVDWAYAYGPNRFLCSPKPYVIPDDYEEGDAFP